MIKAISGGVAHDLPPDLRKVLTSELSRHGKILRRSPAMSGFVGLFPSKNQRRDENTSNGYARSLKKERVALVVGWVVPIERISH